MSYFRTLLPAAVALTAVAAEAQAQRRVTGVVTGEGGTPLAAASVQIVGTQVGTYTNESGRFSIQAGAGTQTLRVRRIGYRARLITVGPGTTDVGSIALERDVLQLEAQVVTGTATSVSRANAANAVTQVSADQLVGRAPAPTVDNALQGKVAGAIISTNSGAPGGGTQVQVRGISSIYGNSTPLYVVDGVIVNNEEVVNGLNALTQAQGANGVMGSLGSGNQDQGRNRIADLNPDEIESIEILKGPSAGAIYGSKGSNGVIVIRTKRGIQGAPRFSTRQAITQDQLQTNRELGLRCFHSSQEATAWWQGRTGDTTASLPTPFTGQCNDLQKEFYTPSGPGYQSSLDVSGGTTGGTTYYVSGLAQRDNAIQQGTYYQKQSLTANLGQTIGKRLTVQFNNNVVHSLTDAGISGNDNSPVVSPVDIFTNTPTFFNLGTKANGVFPLNPYVSSGTNPFQTAELVKLPQDVYRYIGNVNATYNVLASERQTFDVTMLAGLDATGQQNKIYSPPTVYYEPKDGFPGTIVNGNYNAQYANFNLSGVHRYTASAFTATTSFGARREYRNSDLVLVQGQTIPANTFNVSLALKTQPVEQRLQERDLAYYVQEEFLTFQERLLLTAALNAERSSVNGNANTFYYFPKFAASYRLPFLPPGADDIKLRLSYGQAGNLPIYGYAFSPLASGVYSGGLGVGISGIAGNPNIRPEISAEVEGGADLTFFRSRLGLSATMFRTDVRDLILQYTPPPSSGYAVEYINGGAFFKTGTELELKAVPVQSRNFQWNSQLNFSTINSRVKSLTTPCFTVGFFGYGDPYVCTGYSISTIRVPNGGATKDGYTYLDALPRFTSGFSNDFTFGPVRLASQFEWRYGGYVVNLTKGYLDASGLGADTAGARIRNAAAGNGDLRGYTERATFVKLRELNLSYQLPNRFTQRYLGGRARDVRLQVAGRNLYTWAPYTGYDPEVSNFGTVTVGRGQDVTPYPPSRQFVFSLVASF